MGPTELPFGRLVGGLAVLLEAYDWALASGFDPRQFAVKIEQLHEAGLSHTHVSWLICQGFVEHLHEFTQPGDKDRSFRELGRWNFRRRSRIVLSAGGVEFARPLCRTAGGASPAVEKMAAVGTATRPQWDSNRRQLIFGDEVLMRLSTRARNLLRILDVFQEENWPPRIDDPLPSINGSNSKHRLRGAIEKLNESLLVYRIRFSGDGSGESICWTIVKSRRSRSQHRS